MTGMHDIRSKKVLVLSPHPDDAELGVGGYLASITAAGGEAMVILATVGPPAESSPAWEALAATRKTDFTHAMDVLAVQHGRILGQGGDGELRQRLPMSRFVRLLEGFIDEFAPDEVPPPLPSSHQDHVHCWEAGIAATRPRSTGHRPTLVASYEYPLSHWGAGAAFHSFRGGLYTDVTPTWPRKLLGLQAHASQMDRAPGHPIGIEGATTLARLRGMEAGCEYAELPHIVQMRWK